MTASMWIVFRNVLSLLLVVFLSSACNFQSKATAPALPPTAQPAADFPTLAPGEAAKGVFRLLESSSATEDWRAIEWTRGFIEPDGAAFAVVVMSEYDPLPDAKDDEVIFAAIIRSSDPAAIPLHQTIMLPANDLPLTVMLTAFCFCDSHPWSEGSGQYIPTGVLSFEYFSPDKVKGRLELHLAGDIPYFDTEEPFYRDLWKVDVRLDLLIPEFIARPRDGR